MGLTLKELNTRYDEERQTKSRNAYLEYEELKASLVEYDEKQQKILYTDASKYIVSGPAGSGKTVIAMMKAMELEKKGDDYIIIMYTKALKYFWEGKMKKCDFKDIEHKIYYEEELFNNKEKDEELRSRKVDYVIIDEVQDFPSESIQKYISIAQKGYFLYGDNGQQIYPERTQNRDIIMEIIKKVSPTEFELARTYRVPEKIAKVAEQIDKRNTHISKDCYMKGDDKPRIIEFSDFDSEMIYLVNMIKKEGWKNVGILLRNNDDVTDVADCLNKLGNKLELVFEQKDKNLDNIDFSTNNPKILTYHSSKGLEFDRVFIPYCAYNKDPKKYNYREALFVAITRARESLILSYEVDNKCQYIDEININIEKK